MSLQSSVFFFFLLASLVDTMAVTSSSSSSSSVSRVAIVGAGPGGLALANALRTLNTGVKDIYVYDGRADISSTAVGGGVQLSGGAKVLEHLHLLPEIEAVAERLTRVRGRNVRRETLLDIDLNQACLQSKEREALLSREGKNPLLFSIMRSSLQEILLKAAKNPMSGSSSSSASIKIIPNTNIAAIAKASNQKYSLTLKDGSLAASDFDMVFGCDGVNSIVRDFIQAGGKYASSSSSSFSPSFLEKRSYSPGYSGLRVGYVLTKVDKKFALRPEGRGAFHQWFGDGIYALEASYGSLEGPIHMLAIVFKDDADAALGENPEWVTTSLLEQFQRRLARGGLNKVAEIQTLMAAADGNRCIEIGVRESLFPLPTWSSKDGRVLLMGDAAHAM